MLQGVSTWNFDSPAASAAYRLDFSGPSTPSDLTFTRASSAAEYDSDGVLQTYGTDVPRMGFDPVTHSARGLRLEGLATNYLLNSAAAATQTTGTLATGSYTLWVEGSGSATVAAGTAVGANFGTASSGAPVVFTVTTSGTVTVTVTGSVTAFQLEGGTVPTSLIVTVGTTATRAADVASILNFPYSMSAGTLIVTAMLAATAAGGNKIVALTVPAGAENDLVDMFFAPTVRQSSVKSAAVISASMLQGGATVPLTKYKIGVALALNDFALVVNGTVAATDNVGAMPAALLSSMALGKRSVISNSQFLNGWILDITYYDTRLTNAQIQALTV